MFNNWCFYWDFYDPYGFGCNWRADAIDRLDTYRGMESLRSFRRAESFSPCRVFKMRWFVSATGK